MSVHVLQVNLDDAGGAFALMYKVQQQLYKENSDIKFDYFTMAEFRSKTIEDHIHSMGGEIHSANLRRNRLVGHVLLPFYFYKFLRKNPYDTIHIHSDTSWKICVYAIPAKFAKVKNVVIHSHSGGINGDHRKLKLLMHRLMRPIIPYVGTKFCSCSDIATKWMYNKKVINKVVWVKNGVDTQAFMFRDEIRSRIREELRVENNDFLIGVVGDFSFQKYPEYAFKIFKNLKTEQKKRETTLGCTTEKKNYKMFFIGSGEREDEVKEWYRSEGLLGDAIFFGKTSKVNEMLNAVDLYLMPSRFEGLPVSAIEAQANGLPCVLSTEITSEVGITEFCRFDDLKEEVSEWVKDIEDLSHMTINRNKGAVDIRQNGFDIRQTAAQVRNCYGLD